MAFVGSYFVSDKKNLIANKECVLQGEKYRISLLTPRLIRLEYSSNGVFEDRQTERVVNRNFKKVSYNSSVVGNILTIDTEYFTLIYDKNKHFDSGKLSPGMNLRITLKESDKSWYYGHPEVRNFGSLSYSLDDYNGKVKYDMGLYSTDGFVSIDDSNSFVIDNDMYVKRENKSIDIYLFMYRKNFGYCLIDYYELTGYPSLINRNMLGNIWYKNEDYDINSLNKLLSNFNDNNIKISSFLFGNKFHDGNDFYSFYRDGSDMVNLLHKFDINVGLCLNPEYGINSNSRLYGSVSNILQNDNKQINFLPLTNETINAYFNGVVRGILGSGIDYLMLDYNNSKDRNGISILNHCNFVGNCLSRNLRGNSISRNSGMCMHRYGIIYTGNTKVDWRTLEILPFYTASASNYGVSWVASPIGGYYSGIEEDELFIRYIQYGCFSPVFMLGSQGGKYYKREPWKWDIHVLEIIREYMGLRNKLIPYIYSEAYNYHKIGYPFIQPLYYQYPKLYDESIYRNQYMFGSCILVSPIVKKKNSVMNRVVQRVFIPEGTWYDIRSGKIYKGNKYYINFYKDEEYPFFCKAGSIIPMSLDNSCKNPVNMEIHVFPLANGSYKMYEDDGTSLNEQHTITEYSYIYEKGNYVFNIKPIENRGGNVPGSRNYYIRFRNTKYPSSISVTVGGNKVNYNAFINHNDLVIYVPNVISQATLCINISGDNLEESIVEIINDDIKDILEDLEINTDLKNVIDDILFSDMSIRKKRIAIRKLKRKKLEPKFITMFISLLEYIEKV